MEKQLLDRLTPSDRAALLKVAALLNQAQQAWNLIESGKQCELNAEHNEEGSLAHALRWGTQAAEDLCDLTKGISAADVEYYPADYTGVVEVEVTAKTHEEAAKFVLDDLRDRSVGPWNIQVTNSTGSKTISVGQPVAQVKSKRSQTPSM